MLTFGALMSQSAVPDLKPLALDFEQMSALAPPIVYVRDSLATAHVGGYLSTFADGMARLIPGGLVLEEGQTNWLRYSESFNHFSWNKTNCTSGFWAEFTPENVFTSMNLTEDSADTAKRVEQSVTGRDATVSWSHSIYARAEAQGWIKLAIVAGGGVVEAWFDLTNGIVGTARASGGGVLYGASMQSIANGWHRCAVFGVPDAGGGESETLGARVALANQDLGAGYLGTGAVAVLIFGAQFEQRAIPSTYIKTSNVVQSRAADTATVSLSDIAFDAGAGTVLIEGDWALSSFGNRRRRVVQFDDGSDDNRIALEVNETSGTLEGMVVRGGVTQATLADAYASGAGLTAALAWSGDGATLFVNGTQIGTDTTVDLPLGLNTLRIGQSADGNSGSNGRIRRLVHEPRRLADVELQAITA